MDWLYGALAALCLAVGLWHLAVLGHRLVRRRGDAALEAGYAVMALGMAGMFSPVGDPVPAPAWATVFVLCGLGSAGLLVRCDGGPAVRGEARHLVVGSAAMLFMLAADREAGDAGGHAGHGAGPGLAVGLASAVALGLAAYFVLHLLRCADRWCAAGRDPGPAGPGRAAPVAVALAVPVSERSTARLAAAAHLLMTAAMAAMLVDMI